MRWKQAGSRCGGAPDSGLGGTRPQSVCTARRSTCRFWAQQAGRLADWQGDGKYAARKMKRATAGARYDGDGDGGGVGGGGFRGRARGEAQAVAWAGGGRRGCGEVEVGSRSANQSTRPARAWEMKGPGYWPSAPALPPLLSSAAAALRPHGSACSWPAPRDLVPPYQPRRPGSSGPVCCGMPESSGPLLSACSPPSSQQSPPQADTPQTNIATGVRTCTHTETCYKRLRSHFARVGPGTMALL